MNQAASSGCAAARRRTAAGFSAFGQMKAILKELQTSPCRIKPISDTERQLFEANGFTHLQRFHPGIGAFTVPEPASIKLATLPTFWDVTGWIDVSGGGLIHTASLSDPSGNTTVASTFIKIIHLLDPVAMLREEYMTPDHPLLPQGQRAWKNTLYKLHSQNNQAVVDTVAGFVLSRLRERGITPHCVLAYGSMSCIASAYKYRISDDFHAYRQCRWFWNGLKTQGATLRVLREGEVVDMSDEILNSPFEHEDRLPQLLEHLDEIPPSWEGVNTESVMNELEELELADLETASGFSSDGSASSGGSGDSGGSGSDASSGSEDGLEVALEFPQMPVMIVFQEAQEGTMDALAISRVCGGITRFTPAWDKMWLAWLFQIITVLSVLQRHLSFTHNDLHTNNIIWRHTEEKWLWYRTGDGTTWRVPTYGRIFSIIDFGRAIFRLGQHLWLSDDHAANGEAHGQYNFGPIYNIEKPKVPPNPSFDLCRLALSMLEAMYRKHPAPDTKNREVLSRVGTEEGSVVYSTVSPLFNLLWSWTVDDSGQTVAEDEMGDERFDGFELYVKIAATVHCAVPAEQMRKPVFDRFRWKGKAPRRTQVFSV